MNEYLPELIEKNDKSTSLKNSADDLNNNDEVYQ